MTKTRPAIYVEHPALDVLAELPVAMVTARNLKPGHVVLDPEFRTPLYSVDHRSRSATGSGEVSLFVLDYETGRFHHVSILASASIPVVASS